jgi:hypothetical protein
MIALLVTMDSLDDDDEMGKGLGPAADDRRAERTRSSDVGFPLAAIAARATVDFTEDLGVDLEQLVQLLALLVELDLPGVLLVLLHGLSRSFLLVFCGADRLGA